MRESLTQPNELAAIVAYATGKRSLMEIGIGVGGTSREIRRVMHENATLTLIDPLLTSELTFGAEIIPRTNQDVITRINSVPRGTVSFLQTTSLSAHALYSGKPLDYLFIDGDHSKEAVLLDWSLWTPFVRLGGLVLLHDVAHWCPGVLAAYAEIDKSNFREIEKVHGLQVLQRIK